MTTVRKELQKTMNTGFTIRQMAMNDVELAVDWAADEGWNPGLNDAGCFYHTDPNGFFIGKLDGEEIGCISAVSYDDSFGFIGFYIIRKEHRGRRYGIELARRAMSYLGARNIGIDGVVGKIRNYEKFGFTLAHKNVRYAGRGGGSASFDLVELSTVPFGVIVSYDAAIFPARRDRFLERWINQPGSASFGCVEGNELKGYGVIRPCWTGFKIGPLFADSPDIAERLFGALAGKVSPQIPVFLDVPATNPAALSLAYGHHMMPVFETGRMYNKEAPAVPMEKIFGVTSFELG